MPESGQYLLTNTSSTSTKVDDRILCESGTTRKVLRATIVENTKNPEAIFKITLVHQRKKSSDVWEDSENISLSTLKSGEGVKLDLDSETTLRLFEEMQNLQGIAEKIGIKYGRRSVELLKVTPDKAPAIQKIISNEYPNEMLALLANDHPDIVAKLGAVKIHEVRAKALNEFERSLREKGDDESYWQDFFEINTWIFGYGLNYQVLRTIQNQPYYGGKDYTNTGGQRGDYLEATQAAVKFTVLVEIKTPKSPLLGNQYRNGCWSISSELAGGVAQLQGNCSTWESHGATVPTAQEALTKQSIYTVRPKGILILGHCNELTDIEKRNSFQLFRRELNNPEVLTFDEVYERAKFLVESSAQS